MELRQLWSAIPTYSTKFRDEGQKRPESRRPQDFQRTHPVRRRRDDRATGAGPDFQRAEGLGVQERAVAAVLIAAKVQPGCREIGGEAEHLDAGGTGGFFREPELQRGVAGGGEEVRVVADGEGGDGSLPGF